MRWVFICLFALAGLAAAAQEPDAIESVIAGQLAAFSDRDIDQAWTYASPNIRGLVGDPDRFGVMVETGYPMVWNNAEVRFLDLREIAGVYWQRVMIRDAAGALHLLDYQMVETANGWRINAVKILPAPDVGA